MILNATCRTGLHAESHGIVGNVHAMSGHPCSLTHLVLRIFGTLEANPSFITTARRLLGFLIGGLANPYDLPLSTVHCLTKHADVGDHGKGWCHFRESHVARASEDKFWRDADLFRAMEGQGLSPRET